MPDDELHTLRRELASAMAELVEANYRLRMALLELAILVTVPSTEAGNHATPAVPTTRETIH